MRKIIMSLSFILLFSMLSFGNENCITENHSNVSKDLSFDNSFAFNYKIVVDKYDICTVTVTITFSNGNSYSATASNNQGNCDAARDAAYERALLLSKVFK